MNYIEIMLGGGSYIKLNRQEIELKRLIKGRLDVSGEKEERLERGLKICQELSEMLDPGKWPLEPDYTFAEKLGEKIRAFYDYIDTCPFYDGGEL